LDRRGGQGGKGPSTTETQEVLPIVYLTGRYALSGITCLPCRRGDLYKSTRSLTAGE
jgi:hypothetical protein